MLTAKYTQDPIENHLRDAEAAFTDWSPYILQDFGHILYPEVANLDSVVLDSFREVSGTDFMSSSAVIDGLTLEVYYGWLLNYIFIAPSLECLEAAQFDVYAPHGH